MAAAPSSAAASAASSASRRHWPAQLFVSAYDVRVGILASDAQVLRCVCERLPPGSRTIGRRRRQVPRVDLQYSIARHDNEGRPDAARAPVYTGYIGDAPFVVSTDTQAVADAFESAVRLDVATATTRWAFVHAGVVGGREGAIVIPAPSMHGKSTLVDALVRAGATYYSDEFAVVDDEGLVHPFRIPLSLRTGASGARRLVPAGPDRLAPMPIRLVVSTAYRSGAGWQPRHGTPGEAMMALFANTVRARIAPAVTMRTLARAAAAADFVEGPRGEADLVARALLARLEQRPERTPQ